MKIEQVRWTQSGGWEPHAPHALGGRAQLIFAFGGAPIIERQDLLSELKRIYPAANLIGCSTAGEIFDTQVSDDALVVTAVDFEKTKIKGSGLKLNEIENSFESGRKLAENVTVTGGLAGDSDRFGSTFVIWNDVPKKDTVAVLGFYGKNLKVGYASLGGWDPFGPERLITRSKGNVLFEMDGQSALDLYKKYLGDHAKDLPSSGLLFPLSLRVGDNNTPIVRTILGINEAEQSM